MNFHQLPTLGSSMQSASLGQPQPVSPAPVAPNSMSLPSEVALSMGLFNPELMELVTVSRPTTNNGSNMTWAEDSSGFDLIDSILNCPSTFENFSPLNGEEDFPADSSSATIKAEYNCNDLKNENSRSSCIELQNASANDVCGALTSSIASSSSCLGGSHTTSMFSTASPISAVSDAVAECNQVWSEGSHFCAEVGGATLILSPSLSRLQNLPINYCNTAIASNNSSNTPLMLHSPAPPHPYPSSSLSQSTTPSSCLTDQFFPQRGITQQSMSSCTEKVGCVYVQTSPVALPPQRRKSMPQGGTPATGIQDNSSSMFSCSLPSSAWRFGNMNTYYPNTTPSSVLATNSGREHLTPEGTAKSESYHGFSSLPTGEFQHGTKLSTDSSSYNIQNKLELFHTVGFGTPLSGFPLSVHKIRLNNAILPLRAFV
ncbi:unnamed protein product [Dibothriocephalus latus]|uniref:Uncharacterized protein n=1 Tax=Dibothriocephalus latus TaxID=60516 RepID=A0A3P7P7G2_DIBLA|nr:unnamed protein product [Dibothriocephalus latus]